MRALIVTLLLLVAWPVRAALLAEGEMFPAWTLKDHTGITVTSTDLAGKTYLLWFYPKAQTSGCTTEGGLFRDYFDKFETAHVQILGVSFDTPEANAAFVKSERFPFRLLSDTDRDLATKVGAADTKDTPVARRISYLVGGDGKVIKAYGTVRPETHAKDVLADVPK